MKTSKNGGLDLLRLVFMLMVCVFNVLIVGGIERACTPHTLQYNVYYFLEAFALCAIDGFTMIYGYLAYKYFQRYEKIVEMWFQVIFYSLILTLIFSLFGLHHLYLSEIPRNLLILTHNRYWYFSALFALALISPLLNKLIFSLDERSAKKVLIVIFVLFSCMSLIADPFTTEFGYSFIWVVVLYCIGGLIKRAHLFENKKTFVLVIIWFGCIIFSYLAFIIRGRTLFLDFTSPTILLSAILMVIIFSRIEFNNKVLSKASSLALGIYFFQLNPVIWNKIYNNLVSIVHFDIVKGTLSILLVASGLFIGGLFVEFIRSGIARMIQIPTLSKTIILWINQLLEKIIIVLK